MSTETYGMNKRQREQRLRRRQRHARESRGREVTRQYKTKDGLVVVTHVAGPPIKQDTRREER